METIHTDGIHDPIITVETTLPNGEEFPLVIPLASVVVEAELLGYEDMGESLEAIINKLQHGTEPNPDPETGENAWTEAFSLLTMREQEREDAAREVQKHEGYTEHQVQVASAQMAYRAVHEPINGGECALDRCRRAAREKMSAPEPTRKCGVESRGQAAQVLNNETEAGAAFTRESLEYLGKVRSAFLHSLVGTDDDNPLGDTPPPPEPENTIQTADQLLQKYGDAS